jgi:hypothetical protein
LSSSLSRPGCCSGAWLTTAKPACSKKKRTRSTCDAFSRMTQRGCRRQAPPFSPFSIIISRHQERSFLCHVGVMLSRTRAVRPGSNTRLCLCKYAGRDPLVSINHLATTSSNSRHDHDHRRRRSPAHNATAPSTDKLTGHTQHYSSWQHAKRSR